METEEESILWDLSTPDDLLYNPSKSVNNIRIVQNHRYVDAPPLTSLTMNHLKAFRGTRMAGFDIRTQLLRFRREEDRGHHVVPQVSQGRGSPQIVFGV